MEADLQGKQKLVATLLHRSNGVQSLQLLEYLIKHGSERVVDDARSHISTLKMLRNFHYIDEKGKDEGINGKSIVGLVFLVLVYLVFSSQSRPRNYRAAFRCREDSY